MDDPDSHGVGSNAGVLSRFGTLEASERDVTEVGAFAAAVRLEANAATDVLTSALADLAPARERLEYQGRVHTTPMLALGDKQNSGFVTGTLLGLWWLLAGFTRRAVSRDPEWAVLTALIDDPARPRDLRHRLEAMGHVVTEAALSRLLKRLRERGAVVATRLGSDRRGLVYRAALENGSRPPDRHLAGACEILQVLADTPNRDQPDATLLVGVVGDVGRAMRDAPVEDVRPFVERLDAVMEGPLLTRRAGDASDFDHSEVLGGVLWATADSVDAFLRRHATLGHRTLENASRAQLRKWIVAFLQEHRSANPKTLVEALARDGFAASPTQLAKAIGDLIHENIAEPVDSPADVDGRSRYYGLVASDTLATT